MKKQKYKVYYACSNCKKEIWVQEGNKDAQHEISITDYCGYCNCIHKCYPTRSEVIND